MLWKARRAADIPQPSFLERLSQTPAVYAAPGADADYLALLDRCLLDGHISVSEAGALVQVAIELGLTREAAEELNQQYFSSLAERAWADGVLSTAEIAELETVGSLLDIPARARGAALLPPEDADASSHRDEVDHFQLRPGDMIVLTGEMSRERSEWSALLEQLGYLTHTAVTKKVRLVAAADPDSLSGKARKARDYGIPIVDEAGLVRMLTALHPGYPSWAGGA